MNANNFRRKIDKRALRALTEAPAPVVATTTSDSTDVPEPVTEIQSPESTIRFTPFVAGLTKTTSVNIGSMWAQLQEQQPPHQLHQIFNVSFRPFGEVGTSANSSLSSFASTSSLRQIDDSKSKLVTKEDPENRLIVALPSNTETAAEKGGNEWDGYLDDQIPDKKEPKVVRNLRHIVFSLYRRLFGVVFIVNMSIFIHVLARGGLPANKIGTIVVGNICAAVLMRQVKWSICVLNEPTLTSSNYRTTF